MSKGILSCIRGISPLIATLILIGATVAGGAIVYAVMRGQMSSLAGAADLDITNADIIVAGGSQLATVTVRNSGGSDLSNVAVTVSSDAGDVSLPAVGSLTVGQSKSVEGTGSWTTGKPYIVKVSATAANGGTITKSLTVVAHS